MAASLTNASSASTGTSITVTANVTITVTGTLTLPWLVVIYYSTDDTTFVKTGLTFGVPGVYDVDLNSASGYLRADLIQLGSYDSVPSVNVSVDIS